MPQPMLPISPMMLDTLTMRPLPRSAMWRRAAWERKKAPERFTLSTLNQSSSAILSTVLVAGDPGVVDQDVQPPVRLDHLVDGAAAIAGLSHVALVDAHGGAVRAREGLAELARRLVVARVARCEHRALAGQAAADGRTDAARAKPRQGESAVSGAEDHFRGSLERLLRDLYWLRVEWAALRRLENKDHIGLDFFRVVYMALLADSQHRLGRILDTHRASYSFWRLRDSDRSVEAMLQKHGLSVQDVQSLSDRFEPIRHQTLAHTDPRTALHPDALYEGANILGAEIVRVADGLWAGLRGYYLARFGCPFPAGSDYSGDDIDRIHADYLKWRGGCDHGPTR
jgi:hypothetical protein